MELDITDFFNGAAPRDYSASQAELGRDAGAITWGQACKDAPSYPLLDTEEKREAFRDHVKGYGAWSEEEIASWTDNELTALLLQDISADIRDTRMEPDAFDWEKYEEGANAGRYRGNLFKGTDGRIYFTLGS